LSFPSFEVNLLQDQPVHRNSGRRQVVRNQAATQVVAKLWQRVNYLKKITIIYMIWYAEQRMHQNKLSFAQKESKDVFVSLEINLPSQLRFLAAIPPLAGTLISTTS
jgi:hypothetical protein